ncbi:MAG: hypothetical protein PHU03_07615, partial [Syntrophales bacterium]|nr:hypothetical protein [Syntrophales bacterium]
EVDMRYLNSPKRNRWIVVSMLLISLAFFLSIAGCSQSDTGKAEAPKKTEAPAPAPVAAAPQEYDGEALVFRGITMGEPLEAQFEHCDSKPEGPCYREGIEGDPYKEYIIEGLPDLGIRTTEFVSLIDGNIELYMLETDKELVGRQILALVQGMFGDPASDERSMLEGAIPYEVYLKTWDVKGCLVQMSNIRTSELDPGRLLIKSAEYLKQN